MAPIIRLVVATPVNIFSTPRFAFRNAVELTLTAAGPAAGLPQFGHPNAAAALGAPASSVRTTRLRETDLRAEMGRPRPASPARSCCTFLNASTQLPVASIAKLCCRRSERQPRPRSTHNSCQSDWREKAARGAARRHANSSESRKRGGGLTGRGDGGPHAQ